MKQRNADLEQKRKEEEAARIAAAEAELPAEERAKIQAKKDANDKKLEGNACYKNRNFEAAIECYNAAIALDKDEVTYYNNLAAVYFEMKNYDACVETCEIGIGKSKGANFDALKLCKAMGRKANALA